MSVTPKQSWADRARRRPLFFWIALLLGAGMLGAYLFEGAMIWRYGTLVRDTGWQPERRHGQWIVRAVDPQSVAARKLQAGDVILAINDDVRIARIDSSYVWPQVLKQDTYTLAIQRGPEQRRVELQMELRHDYRIWEASFPTLPPVSAFMWSGCCSVYSSLKNASRGSPH
jgi:hypothetical protein